MDEKFEPRVPESKETKIYSFDEGVLEATNRIKDIFEKSDSHVFVAIVGSDIDVGKSFLLNELSKGLITAGIDTEVTQINEQNVPEPRKVFFSTMQIDMYRPFIDAKVRSKKNLADFYIGIYRPDRKFIGSPLPTGPRDLVICDEKAKDKK
jgi:hypothetical protein